MLYPIIKRLLFCFPPETAHTIALKSLKLANALGCIKNNKLPEKTIKCFGLTFKNPLGLAAGLDKNGDYIDALGALGFGFLELGAVTPKPQPGNPKPRLFRLEKEKAIINAMGFNNKGVDYLIEQIKKSTYDRIIGVNLGKNKETPLENAVEDYRICFEKLYPYVDFVTINISSPNTKDLRLLQQDSYLRNILQVLKQQQKQLSEKHGKYVPLLVKVSPDLSIEDIQNMATIFLEENIEGVIATNTTLSRKGVEDSVFVSKPGGLSGKPLCVSSTEVLASFHKALGNKIPVIGVGGISSAEDIARKQEAGASLFQLYTGLIYEGPGIVRKILRELSA